MIHATRSFELRPISDNRFWVQRNCSRGGRIEFGLFFPDRILVTRIVLPNTDVSLYVEVGLNDEGDFGFKIGCWANFK